MELMRIAIFYNLNFGGAKRAVFEQVKLLKAKGHLVDTYTTDSKIDAFDLSKVSSSFHRFDYKQTENKTPFLGRLINDIRTFFILPSLHKRIAKQIDGGKYDVVLVHPDKVTQSPFILRYLKTKSAYYCQEPLRIVYEYVLKAERNIGIPKYTYEQITRLIRKKIDIENVRSATFTIASCYHVRERMIESYGVYPYVSYLGIDTSLFRPLRVKKKNQVFFVGSKDVWSDGYDLVEKALRLIPKKNRPKLRIVSWVSKNNERLSDQELVRQYNESFVTLCTSRLETFGLVPLESMACGTVVIATKVSGHRETVDDNNTGFLVDFDPNEISEKILYFTKNPKIVSEMGNKARKHVEKSWAWTNLIYDLEKILKLSLKK